MLCPEHLFIPSPPVQRAKENHRGTSKTVRFPSQVAEGLTKLPEHVSLEHLPFLYQDFSFIAFLTSRDPWW